MEAELVARDIPYQFIGGTSLMQSAHVKDLLCMARAAIGHRDELAWARYLTLWPGIGDVTAARLIASMAQRGTDDEAAAVLRKHGKVRSTLVDGTDAIRQHADRPSRAIGDAARTLGPLLEKRYDRWDSRKRDLDLLVQLATRHRSLAAFLETYTLEPVYATAERASEDLDAVTLITVHSAKGAEAPVCYLIRVEPGVYPHARSLGDEDAEEEERRILYVAMTRARDDLILTRTNERFGRTVLWGGHRASQAPGGTTYLLDDIPDDLVDASPHEEPAGGGWEDDVIAPWRPGR